MLSNIKIGLSLVLIPILIALALGGVPDVRQSAHHVHAAPLDQVSCVPRPQPTVTRAGTTQLWVTATATGAGNTLRQIRAETGTNVRVGIAPRSGSPPLTVDLPSGTTQQGISLSPVDSAAPLSVNIVIVDACGDWPTSMTTASGATPTATTTATPTATLMATSTPTVTSLPTATRTVTLTPAATATAVPAAMIEGVPICTVHDPLRWHPLVERNTDGSIRCTYGHEHHDNPDSVADIFGATGAWYGSSQSISYPWQTFAFPNPQPDYYPLPQPGDPSTLENNAKHNGYKWYVKRDLPCIPASADYAPGCVRAYRVQVHSQGTHHDTTVRFHSFSSEALVDYQGQQGVVRGGGWMDTGFLGMLVDGGNAIVCPPLATNPPGFTCPAGSNGTMREAASVNPPPPHTAHGATPLRPAWYATHRGGISSTLSVEDWGAMDYNTLTQQLYPPQYRANNSNGNLGSMMAVSFEPSLTADAQGLLTGVVYKNRHGLPTTGCTAAGLDCVPFTLARVRANSYFSFNQGNNIPVYAAPDHDVASPVTGNSLIAYPN